MVGNSIIFYKQSVIKTNELFIYLNEIVNKVNENTVMAELGINRVTFTIKWAKPWT